MSDFPDTTIRSIRQPDDGGEGIIADVSPNERVARMLDINHSAAMPNWQRVNVYRLGKQHRCQPSRFIYVKNLGWFVYVRAELLELPGLISQGGVLGPFEDINGALNTLQAHLQTQLS